MILIPKNKRGRPRKLETMDTLAVRIPDDLVERIDLYSERLQTDLPGLNISRADSIRQLITVGLREEEKRMKMRTDDGHQISSSETAKFNFNEIEHFIKRLGGERPVFHSEADFQHALAWIIHDERPDLKVRLERPVRLSDRTIAIDLWLIDNNLHNFAIELKYYKASFTGILGDEAFEFPDNNPRDYCYNVLNDVRRLENLIENEEIHGGAVILISNDPKDWNSKDKGTNFENFSLFHGRKISRNEALDWKAGTAKDYKGPSRLEPIRLKNDYTLDWKHFYKNPEMGKNSDFKWLGFDLLGKT